MINFLSKTWRFSAFFSPHKLVNETSVVIVAWKDRARVWSDNGKDVQRISVINVYLRVKSSVIMLSGKTHNVAIIYF